ncbi:prepilin-type N-terminal cleavage/methylation domain-containing protein, partial [Klebsiella michiganensis]
MNREHGYTLIETLLTMVVVVILGASGQYGWQS